jgi:hypothetical protein
VLPKTHILWGIMVTPPIRRGCSPEKGGRALGSVPKTKPLVLLRKMEAPKVAMMRMRTEAFRKG